MVTVAVKLIAQPSTDTGGNSGFATAIVPFRMLNWARIGCLLGMKERTPLALAEMDNQAGTIGEGTFQMHRQASLTEGIAVFIKVAHRATLG